MFTFDLPEGDAVRIGPYVLQVLAVQPGRVVVGLVDPETDCSRCGRTLLDGRCPACRQGPPLRSVRPALPPR